MHGQAINLTKVVRNLDRIYLAQVNANAAQQFDLGRSAAISLIYFAIILAIHTIYRTMNPKLS